MHLFSPRSCDRAPHTGERWTLTLPPHGPLTYRISDKHPSLQSVRAVRLQPESTAGPTLEMILRPRARHAELLNLAALMQRLSDRLHAEHGYQAAAPHVWGLWEDAPHDQCALVVVHVHGRPWKLELDGTISGETEITAKERFLAHTVQILCAEGQARLARYYHPRGWLSPTRVRKRIDASDRADAGLCIMAWPMHVITRIHGKPQLPALSFQRASTVAPTATPPAPSTNHEKSDAPLRPSRRRAWLLKQIRAAEAEGMIQHDTAARLMVQADDPFIRAYLFGLALHTAMLPATSLVVLLGCTLHGHAHGWGTARTAECLAVVGAFFAVSPVSPGSLMRGLAVLIWVIRRKQLKGFKTALFCSFWRYIGMSAFPIQMVTTFPELARLLAARSTRRMTRLVPVLGRPGGRLEYWLFTLLFNVPIRFMKKRKSGRQRRG